MRYQARNPLYCKAATPRNVLLDLLLRRSRAAQSLCITKAGWSVARTAPGTILGSLLHFQPPSKDRFSCIRRKVGRRWPEQRMIVLEMFGGAKILEAPSQPAPSFSPYQTPPGLDRYAGCSDPARWARIHRGKLGRAIRGSKRPADQLTFG